MSLRLLAEAFPHGQLAGCAIIQLGLTSAHDRQHLLARERRLELAARLATTRECYPAAPLMSASRSHRHGFVTAVITGWRSTSCAARRLGALRRRVAARTDHHRWPG